MHGAIQFLLLVCSSFHTAADLVSLTAVAEVLLGHRVNGTARHLDECGARTHCTVPEAETWVVTSSVDLETLTVRGTLVWDTARDDLELRTGYLLVEQGGRFQLGTGAAPMNKRATIYIKKGPHKHRSMGNRFLGSYGPGAQIIIHGRKLQRVWTLLRRTAKPGATQLLLKHDPAAMGWRVGDRIGLATTHRGRSAEYRVERIAPGALHLDRPLAAEHWGGFKEVFGRRFEMAAEVVNLDRSVLITGDHWDFHTTKQGLHVKMHGRGLMDIRYAREEFCGQRDVLGRYCLHFHLGGQCPRCAFEGNAIVEGQQVGITIHGTHRTLVDSNVVWDAVGAGIYTEDGNEMNNTISRNVMICTHYKKCSQRWLGSDSYAGIYMVGMTNDVVENRVAGYENGIWTRGSNLPGGQGRAKGRVCPQFMPFGIIRGNVNHDCKRFGMYPDNQMPRRVTRDADGYVTGGCGAFTDSGEDNGAVPANVIEDEFDWHNEFVGQYSSGDISYVRYTSVNNEHPMYWKASKNFADGVSHHIRDSLFVNHDSLDARGSWSKGKLQLLGPAGPFTFLLTNTTFLGGQRWPSCGAICAGQHCLRGVGAGGPCDVQYLLRNVSFAGTDAGYRWPLRRRINFGPNAEHAGKVLPIFISPPGDMSLGGHRAVLSKHLTGFAAVPGCARAGSIWADGHACSVPVRRLNLWSKNVGTVRIWGPGYGVGGRGMAAGRMPWQRTPIRPNAPHQQSGGYAPGQGGYGVPVVAGATYTVEGKGDMVPDFSDVAAGLSGESTSVTVNFRLPGSEACELHPRSQSFLGSFGLGRGMASPSLGAVCSRPKPTTATTTTTTTAWEPLCPGEPSGSCSFASPPPVGGSYYWEPCCCMSMPGCRADGEHDECRFCGFGEWSGVPCPAGATNSTAALSG